MTATVEEIWIGPREAGPLESVGSVRAMAGRGLEGDRNTSPPDRWAGSGVALTLIETEAVEAVAAEHAIDLRQGRSRRQVVTRGIALNELVGQEFAVGPVRCRGVELCEPCTHLESLTEPGAMKALVHRGGLRADILSDGTIAIGDPVGVPMESTV